MLAFFEGSSIISFRILSILLLFTLTTCQSNNQNLPTSIANQVDSKLDEVEPLSIPQRNSQDDFEGSGVNPDDEDGDVDEGSGDGIEGSGSPPIDDNAQIDTQTNINNIEERGRRSLTIMRPVFSFYQSKFILLYSLTNIYFPQMKCVSIEI
uniref:Uncharacterized protein n=1 Tax=Meloidogyne enterolobii TaxID=390850 RepID=A0A6V7VCU4_MELEN|nr:unnamed protein product [Meloidogyne enterolobii]